MLVTLLVTCRGPFFGRGLFGICVDDKGDEIFGGLTSIYLNKVYHNISV